MPSFLAVALVVSPVLQADPPGFVMWDASVLPDRNTGGNSVASNGTVNSGISIVEAAL